MANKKFHTGVDLKSTLKISSITAGKALIIDGSGLVTNSAVSSTELGYLAGVSSDIQTQINAKASQTDLDNHINDVSDAHDASAISNVPSGNLAATDVQAALNELQSDVDSRALDSIVIKKDGSVAFTAAQSMGGFKLTSVAAPTASSDAATKGYVDSVAEGLKPKQAVRVATTANIVIATALNSGDVIDGVTLANGDRVLVKDQTAAEENGIYVVSATPARSTDFDSLSPIDEINGSLVAVQEGTDNQGKIYVQSGAVAVLDTDDINFVIFNSSATLVGGDGITISGSNVSVDHDGQGLQFVATQLALELDGSTLSKSASGLKLSDTAVTPGSFGSASETVTFTVDAQGRLTAASEQTISITSAEVSDFVEAAQDAVGATLINTASVQLTYDDAFNEISAAVDPAGVNHNDLMGYDLNQHIDHTTVNINTSANSGLAGGSDISASMNLSIDITNTPNLVTADAADLLLIHDISTGLTKNITQADFLAGIASGSPGDISETEFSFADNQSSAADVTGLVFAAGVVRSFDILLGVERGSTFETYKITGVQKSASFDISVESVGDDCGITFSVTNAGQIQYTSSNTGTAGTFRYRAETISIA